MATAELLHAPCHSYTLSPFNFSDVTVEMSVVMVLLSMLLVVLWNIGSVTEEVLNSETEFDDQDDSELEESNSDDERLE